MAYTSMSRMKTLKLPDWAVAETLMEHLCIFSRTSLRFSRSVRDFPFLEFRLRTSQYKFTMQFACKKTGKCKLPSPFTKQAKCSEVLTFFCLCSVCLFRWWIRHLYACKWGLSRSLQSFGFHNRCPHYHRALLVAICGIRMCKGCRSQHLGGKKLGHFFWKNTENKYMKAILGLYLDPDFEGNWTSTASSANPK